MILLTLNGDNGYNKHMDNSDVIIGLFLLVLLIVVVGVVYYLRKAHSLTRHNAENSSLLADVQKELNKRD